MHALLPLQLGMAISYQCVRAYFRAPCTDNKLLCDPKRSHLIMRASNTTRFSSIDRPSFAILPQVYNLRGWIQNFLGEHATRPLSKRATRVLFAYWNPSFQNSRSATESEWFWLPRNENRFQNIHKLKHPLLANTSSGQPISPRISPLSLIMVSRLGPITTGQKDAILEVVWLKSCGCKHTAAKGSLMPTDTFHLVC